MGTWGVGIFEDDFPMDIIDLFNSYIEEGVSSDQAVARLLRLYEEELVDEDDGPLFYFALSLILLDRNDLREDIQKKAIHYIELGTNQRTWKKAGFLVYLTRKRILNSLKKQLIKTEARKNYDEINYEDLDEDRFEPSKSKYQVYHLLDKKTGKPYYVGSTVNLELRSKYFEKNPLRK